MNPHLIACVLGGTAPGAHTELHDVAFAVGRQVDQVHQQLLDGWFGAPEGLHVDAWTVLDSIAGFRVRLQRRPADNGLQLYFVNIGGYRPGEFGERHAWGFFGAGSPSEAKAAARSSLLQGHASTHKDNLHRVDECIALAKVQRWHVCLQPDPSATAAKVTNGYFPIPAATIANWRANRLPAG